MADYNSDRTGANIDATLDKVDVRDTVIDIGSNTTNRITVNSTGNVGIGTDIPTAALDVRGSAFFISTGGTRTTDTPNGNGVEVIGGTTNNMLSYNRTNATYLPIRYRAGVQSWEVNNTERMRIDSAGNVGIGTASPSAKLDVVGDINVSGGVYLGGTGAANKLDDYEEGSWTPTIIGSTGGTATVNAVTTSYTKIGNTVRVDCFLNQADVTGLSGVVRLSGLPFTGSGFSPITVAYCNLFNFDEATDTVGGFTESAAAYVNLTFGSASTTIPATNATENNGTIMFHATYKTTQ